MSRAWNLRDVAKRLFSSEPNDVEGQFSLASDMERRQLIQIALDSFEIENMPEEWDYEYVKMKLLLEGVLCITDTVVGIVPLATGTAGYNIYNRPTKCIVSNVVLGELQRDIGINCALIHIRWDYSGIMDIINYYSYLLANTSGSIFINLMNSRVSFIGECSDEKQAKEMKVMYDKISRGEPAVYARKGVAGNYHFLNPKNTYIADDLMQLRMAIKRDFLATLGIESTLDKRERMIRDEVTSMNAETSYNIGHMLDNMNEGFQVANRLYGLELRAIKKVYNGNTMESDSVGQ